MKLVLIMLVAVVVGLMVACGEKTPPSPEYSKSEVIGAVIEHLTAPGMNFRCSYIAEWLSAVPLSIGVRQDPSNGDKYLVTTPEPDASWTFIGSLGKVISTSSGSYAHFGC